MIFIFLFSTTAFGNKELDKGLKILNTITTNQSIATYLSNMSKVKESEKVVVSVQEFKALLEDETSYRKLLAIKPELEFVTRLRIFIKANNLNSGMVGAPNLQAAQNVYLNIIFMVELLKMISERSDLHFFGAESIRNLNTAISERVPNLYKLADKYLRYSRYSKDIADKIKFNFVNVGLKYEKFLSPSDQWLNEYMGLDRDHVVNAQNPTAVLKTLIDLATRKTNMNLRKRRQSLCSALFT